MNHKPDSALTTVEEYLSTSYEPDVEFVDGVLVERNAADWSHSLIQSNILFGLRRKYPHLKVVVGLRSSMTDSRYRIPDVTALLTASRTRYLLEQPFLVVEVLSEGDWMSRVVEKLREYANKGVPNIWLLDLRLHLMWVYRPATLVEIEGETIFSSDRSIELSRVEIFAE